MKLIYAAVAAVFFLLPFSEALDGMPALAWTGAVLAGLACVVVLGKGRSPVWPGLWIVASFLVLVGIVGSSANADSFRGHVLIGAQVLLFITFGPFALRRLAGIPGVLKAAVGAFLLAQSISSVAGIVQASGTAVLGYKTANGRSLGLASHPNILGVLASVAMVIFLYLLFKTQVRKLPLLIGLGANIGGLLVSGSISSLSACVIGVLVFMFAARVSFKVIATLVVVGGAGLWGVTVLAASGLLRGPAQRIAQVTGQTSDVSTLDIRQNTYSFAWDYIQQDPFFGRGLDSSSGATFDGITLAHNILLRAWFQGGFGLGLAFALIYAAVAAMIIRSLVRGVNAAPAGVLAVLIGFSMTSAALQQGYFWLLLLGAWALIEPRLLGNPASVANPGFLDVKSSPRAAVCSGAR